MGDSRVAAALDRDATALRDGLLPWVAEAQAAGQVRGDLAPDRLVAWLTVVLDGYLGQVAAQHVDPRTEAGMLREVARLVLGAR